MHHIFIYLIGIWHNVIVVQSPGRVLALADGFSLASLVIERVDDRDQESQHLLWCEARLLLNIRVEICEIFYRSLDRIAGAGT
jgi:hypothetical protein